MNSKILKKQIEESKDKSELILEINDLNIFYGGIHNYGNKKDDYHDCEKEHGKGLVDPCMQLLCADYRGVHVPVRRYFFGQGTVCSQLDRSAFHAYRYRDTRVRLHPR